MRVLTIVSILFLLYSCENSSKKNPKSEKKILQSSVFKSLKFDSAFLSSTIFLNGDKIQQAQSAEDWKKFCASKTPAWCYVDQKNKKGFYTLFIFIFLFVFFVFLISHMFQILEIFFNIIYK